jgi:hypothetical protein
MDLPGVVKARWAATGRDRWPPEAEDAREMVNA